MHCKDYNKIIKQKILFYILPILLPICGCSIVILSPQNPICLDGRLTDDTEALQALIDKSDFVNLGGKCYYVRQLRLHSDLILYNGSLISENQNAVLYGSNVSNIKIVGISINGKGSSEKGIFLIDVDNANITRCSVENLTTIRNSTVGVFVRRGVNCSVTKCTIKNVCGITNGVEGDPLGSARAIMFEECPNGLIRENVIYNISSLDDADGIHCLFIGKKSSNSIRISRNDISSCSKRLIKLQQEGIIVTNNNLHQEAPSFCAIGAYGSNCDITKNKIMGPMSMAVFIGGTMYELSNISITYNIIHFSGDASQGAVTSNKPINHLSIMHNIITVVNNKDSAVYLKESCKGILINKNDIYGGKCLLLLSNEKFNNIVDSISVIDNILHDTSLAQYEGYSHKSMETKVNFNNNIIKEAR